MSRALNHEGDKGRTQVKRALVKQTEIKYSAVDKAMATIRATPTTLTYRLKARGDSAAPQQLSRIVQRSYLAVDEEGTEAAAATAAVTTRSAPRRTNIVFDKPFVFALRDSKTGLVLLSGYVGQLPGPGTVAAR